jgi:hypothetical protein
MTTMQLLNLQREVNRSSRCSMHSKCSRMNEDAKIIYKSINKSKIYISLACSFLSKAKDLPKRQSPHV